ncbi:hypothetical protein FRACA_790021 [Frankia canadensis]|uniref:Uncharacterized protein n=1 Tax=Frankia canadensis TaxID=1836972 RepID=A0A2I2L1A7_9ACTN|nr:hypothetical protein FRACA_790021 [Frankia canadensis]SOU58991.1 hypothetical protein FRACA_790021 [Frankia canadensis]
MQVSRVMCRHSIAYSPGGRVWGTSGGFADQRANEEEDRRPLTHTSALMASYRHGVGGPLGYAARSARRGQGPRDPLGLLRLLHRCRPGVGGVDRVAAGGCRVRSPCTGLGLRPGLALDQQDGQWDAWRVSHHRGAVRGIPALRLREGGVGGRVPSRPGGPRP